MTGVVAIGVGCRRDCPAAAIAALVRCALAESAAAQGERALFSIEAKRAEPGLLAAARQLALPLRFFSAERLALEAAHVVTGSPASQARFGAPSVAESSALAGAGADARLIAPRIAEGGATCAIAVGEGGS